MLPDEQRVSAGDQRIRQETLILRMKGASVFCKLCTSQSDLCIQIFSDLATMVHSLIDSKLVHGREVIMLRESLLAMM